MSKIVHIPVEKIQTEGLQTRVAINQEVVREYATAISGGVVLPPIIVFRDTCALFWLADGFHRLASAKLIGQKTIMAEVHAGERVDALRFALGANGTHGVRRTNLDKARAVMLAYENRAILGLPDVPAANLIAELVGVHHAFVTTQLVTVTSWREATARTGADGKTRNLPPVPVRRQEDTATATPATDGNSQVLPPVPMRPSKTGAQAPAAPAAPAVPAVSAEPEAPEIFENRLRRDIAAGWKTGGDGAALDVVDSLGRHVPVDLVPLWRRRQEVQDVLTAVSRIRSALRQAQEGQDPLWAEINFSSTLIHLDRAYTEIDATKPYVVCPMCQGIGCRACKERGLLGKFRYDTVIPRELKDKGGELREGGLDAAG